MEIHTGSSGVVTYNLFLVRRYNVSTPILMEMKKMKLVVSLACAFLLAAPFIAPGQGQSYRLPAGAFVVETQAVAPDRALVLWMLDPTKHPRESMDEFYSCPEETRGSYLRGPTRVSLVDTAGGNVINTVKIKEGSDDAADEFDLPYRIHAGSYYHVEGVEKGQEGKPTLMWLRDYNGDGRAEEFALFDADACMALSTLLVGYSERQDRVILYPVRLTVIEQGQRSTEVSAWAPFLFHERPQSPGHWSFEVDYRGRGGTLDRYEFRYDGQAGEFVGEVVRTASE